MYPPLELIHKRCTLSCSQSTTQVDEPSTCITKDVPSNVLRQRSQAVKPLILCEWGYKIILRREWEESKEFSDCIVLNSLTREKGDTKEFRRLVLRSFGKGRRETQKELRRLVLGEFFLAKGEEMKRMNSTSFQGLENQKTLESFWHKEEEEVQRDSRLVKDCIKLIGKNKDPQGMYPPLFSLNLVDVPSTRTDPQEMYPLLFSVNNPSRCTLYLYHKGCTIQCVKTKISGESKAFSDFVILNSLTREKGDTKEFRRLVLRSFGKGRRETQKEFRRLVLIEFFLAKGEEMKRLKNTSFQGLENQKTLESFWHKEEEEVQRDSRLAKSPALFSLQDQAQLSLSKDPQGMYPPLFSLNLVDVPSTRTDPQEMYPLLFSVNNPSRCTHYLYHKGCTLQCVKTKISGGIQKNSQARMGRIKRILRLYRVEFFDKGEGRHKRIQAVSPSFFLKREKRDTKRIQAEEEMKRMNSTSFQGLENQKTLESFWHKEEEEVQRDSRLVKDCIKLIGKKYGLDHFPFLDFLFFWGRQGDALAPTYPQVQ
ncbi:hypothetical protein HKD37_19G053664 [Glycine soja]